MSTVYYPKEVEVWKDIPGYVGYYQVSTHARVRSLPRVQKTYVSHMNPKCVGRKMKGQIISQHKGNKDRYWRLELNKDKKVKKHFTHTLVAITFIGVIQKGYCVCHNNGNSLHSWLYNIRIDTYSNNEKDKERHGTKLCGEIHHQSKLKTEEVVEIKRLLFCGVAGNIIAKMFKVTPINIYRIRDGRIWKHVV